MQFHIVYTGNIAQADSTAKSLRFTKGIGPALARRCIGGEKLVIETDEPGKVTLLSLMAQGVIEAIELNVRREAPEQQPQQKKEENILMTPTAAAPAPNLGAFVDALVQSVLPAVQSQVQSIVDAAIEARLPREVVIKQADRPDVRIQGVTHPVFDKVLRLASQGVNIMLTGPAGCGKSFLSGQVCEAMGRKFASISMSGGVTESDLLGKLLPTGPGGQFVYTESLFVKMYREGNGFCIDEIDAGDPNTLVCVNQATANSGFDIGTRAVSGLDTFVKRHKDTVLFATANTYGTGAGALYVGRNQLDAATLDRWYVVEMDYDTRLEEQLAPAQVTHFVWKLRDLIKANRWRRVASTRMIQKAGAALAAGFEWKEVRSDLLAGFSGEELSKITF